jgi:hypothetical protein
MAEKSRWDQANRRQKPGEIERKLAKLSKTTFIHFYIILWLVPTPAQSRLLERYLKTT